MITGDSEVPGEIGVHIVYIVNNRLAFGQRFGQSALGTDQADERTPDGRTPQSGKSTSALRGM